MASKPRLPRVLRIGHATYSVKSDPKACESQDAFAFTVPGERSIVMDTTKPHDKQAECLVHELLHACIDSSGLILGKTQEERLCHAMTGPLLSALRDNADTLLPFLLHQE